MKWHFYCASGSPSFRFDGNTPYQRGVGGAEMGLITFTETLAEHGHDVTVFNQPPQSQKINGVGYRHTSEFDLGDHADVFVLFRNPFNDLTRMRTPRKIFWSCDQYTAGNYATDVFPFVDKIVTISPYHADFFVKHYGIARDRLFPIDLPVRIREYAGLEEKNPHMLLYCSVPHRGLQHLLRMFPQIRQAVPSAELWITSDYSLWGEGIQPANEQFRAQADMPGVKFLGKVNRLELVKLQEQASILAYPNCAVGGLEELFCISLAECQVAGTIPVISDRGGISTTTIGGVLLEGEPGVDSYDDHFVSAVVSLLQKPDLSALRSGIQSVARQRFDPETILEQWRQIL